MEKQSVVLRFPKTLLKKVDKYKEQKGFGTRTQTIFHLLQVALEQSERQEKESNSSPPPKEVGVFLLILHKK
jgi:metal-responsive CopG/Arc/MetJ family transcriptional regulator